MICSLFNFCPVCSVQSPRGGLWWTCPQIETWNTIKSVEFLSIFRML